MLTRHKLLIYYSYNGLMSSCHHLLRSSMPPPTINPPTTFPFLSTNRNWQKKLKRLYHLVMVYETLLNFVILSLSLSTFPSPNPHSRTLSQKKEKLINKENIIGKEWHDGSQFPQTNQLTRGKKILKFQKKNPNLFISFLSFYHNCFSLILSFFIKLNNS